MMRLLWYFCHTSRGLPAPRAQPLLADLLRMTVIRSMLLYSDGWARQRKVSRANTLCDPEVPKHAAAGAAARSRRVAGLLSAVT